MAIINDCVLDLENSIDVEPAATPWYDLSLYKNNGTITAGTGGWTQEPSGLWVYDFDGAVTIVTVGNILSSIQTVLLWIAPGDITTRSIMDLDGGTHSIEIDGAGDITATGWAAPAIYVNGTIAAAVTLSAWNCIAVTTATLFAASAIVIGQEASFYLGKIGMPKIFTYVYTAGQVRNYFEKTKHLFGVLD